MVGTTVAAIRATVIRPFVDSPASSLAGSLLPPTLEEEARKATPPPSLEVVSPHLPDSDGPVRGCLQNSWRQWQNISHDRWVTEVIRWGYELEFVSQLPLTPPIPLPLYDPGSEKAMAVDDSVRQMIAKGAVELVDPAKYSTLGFYSRIFVVPKPGVGNWRPIIDLSDLNKFMEVPRCKFETPKSVLQAIGRWDWMASVDLKDAYF